MKTRSVVISITIIFILAAASWWLSQHITASYEDKRLSPTKQIRHNPMSALELLLSDLNKNVQSDNNRKLLHDLPPTKDAIVVRNLMQPLTQEREQALLNWVTQGGQLVYEPYWLGKSDARQYFHEKLGVLITEVEDWQDIQQPNHGWADINQQDLYFHISPQYVLSLEENNPINANHQVVIQSDVGAHGIQVNIGKGSVLFLSDSDFLQTPRVWTSWYKEDEHQFSTDLSHHDHAFFIWQHLQSRNKIWLIYESTSPSFLSVVYKRFPFLSSVSVIWLVLFFLYLLKRFGPIIRNINNEQRNLSQHIQQVGYYHWRQDKGNFLLNQWRNRIKQRIFVKHPNCAGLEDQALFSALENISGLPAIDIQQAWSQPCRNQNDFICYTKRLNTLWTI